MRKPAARRLAVWLALLATTLIVPWNASASSQNLPPRMNCGASGRIYFSLSRRHGMIYMIAFTAPDTAAASEASADPVDSSETSPTPAATSGGSNLLVVNGLSGNYVYSSLCPTASSKPSTHGVHLTAKLGINQSIVCRLNKPLEVQYGQSYPYHDFRYAGGASTAAFAESKIDGTRIHLLTYNPRVCKRAPFIPHFGG